MSIKSIADFYSKIIDTGEVTGDTTEEGMRQMEDFERYAKLAKSVLLERITEKELARFFLGVQNSTLAICVSQGCLPLLLADQDDSLKGYTHSVVLAVIGALIEDEIL